jgi:hypothetical protein
MKMDDLPRRKRLSPHRLVSVEEMSPDEQAAFWNKVRDRHDRNEQLIRQAAAERGGDPGDYFAVLDRAWPRKHVPGGPDCPYGAQQCGYCHDTCNAPDCGICEDRACTSRATLADFTDEDDR